MAANALSVTGGLNSLKKVISDLKEVYYVNKEIKKDDFTNGINATFELPVIEDTINVKFGEVETTEIKLTTGLVWASKSKVGDSDISFSLSSASKEIADLFLENTKKALTAAFEGVQGDGYRTTTKAVSGALLFKAADGAFFVLTNVTMYGSLVVGDGDNPSYFAVKVTPLVNSEGTQFYLLTK